MEGAYPSGGPYCTLLPSKPFYLDLVFASMDKACPSGAPYSALHSPKPFQLGLVFPSMAKACLSGSPYGTLAACKPFPDKSSIFEHGQSYLASLSSLI
jgi:hypothetical protein